MPRKILMSDGCKIRIHKSGMRVIMRKKMPGIYYDGSGSKISPEIARQAGFDVDREIREREKMERIAAAKAAIDREYADKQALSEESINAQVQGGDFAVKRFGDHFAIVDAEGNRVTSRPLSAEDAESMLLEIQAPDPLEDEAEPAAESDDGGAAPEAEAGDAAADGDGFGGGEPEEIQVGGKDEDPGAGDPESAASDVAGDGPAPSAGDVSQKAESDEGDGLSDLDWNKVRARYAAVTGKAWRPGINREEVERAIREVEAADKETDNAPG